MPEIWSAIIQVAGAAVIAVVGYYFGRRKQLFDRNRQRVIETIVTVARLVNPKRFGPISVSVDKSLISGQSSDKGIYERVESAYSYVIDVSNAGLDDLDKPEINITLGNEAVIVEVTVNSDTIPEDKIDKQKVDMKPNFRRIVPEYLNRNDSLAISVLSINESSSKCEIMVGGKGIIHRKRNLSAEFENRNRFGVPEATITIFSILAVVIAVIVGFVVPILEAFFTP